MAPHSAETLLDATVFLPWPLVNLIFSKTHCFVDVPYFCPLSIKFISVFGSKRHTVACHISLFPHSLFTRAYTHKQTNKTPEAIGYERKHLPLQYTYVVRTHICRWKSRICFVIDNMLHRITVTYPCITQTRAQTIYQTYWTFSEQRKFFKDHFRYFYCIYQQCSNKVHLKIMLYVFKKVL